MSIHVLNFTSLHFICFGAASCNPTAVNTLLLHGINIIVVQDQDEAKMNEGIEDIQFRPAHETTIALDKPVYIYLKIGMLRMKKN